MNITPYIGIDYQPKEWDCWQLCRKFAKNELGIEFPRYIYSADKYMDDSEIIISQERSMLGNKWIQVYEPDIGDLVIFRIRGRALHVGICVGNDLFLHTLEGRNSCLEDLDGHWATAIEGFFRYIGHE